MQTLRLLGYAPSYISVIIDCCYEALGVRNFKIYKNIPVEGVPELPYGSESLNLQIFEPDCDFGSTGDPVAFGLSGPWGKYCVYNDFYSKHKVDRPDYINIIHPRAYISPSVSLDTGISVEPGVIISSRTKIAFGVSLKRGVSVGHHNSIGEYTELNPGVIISGNVSIGRGCIIGTGAVVKDRVTIGENSMIGMGSVVTRDIPSGVIAFGNPCKVVRDNDKWRLP